jgi:hypothetical protein
MYRICHHDPDLGDLGEPIRGLVVECLNRDENSRVSIEQVAGFIESDYTSSLADLARVAAVEVAPTDFEYSATQRIEGRGRKRQSTVIVNPGGQTVPARAANEPKSSKRGVLVLASIAVLASLAAVVALVTSGSEPQSQAADELPAVEAEPTDSSTVDATNPSETLAEDLESQEAVTVGSEPPATEPVSEVSGVSARPAIPTTLALAPTTTQPPAPGAIDGAPSAYGYRYDSNDSYSTSSEKFTIHYSLNDPDGVSKSTIQVRRSNNQIVSRCRNSSQLTSGTRFGGEWRAECIIDDQQPSTAYSRTYTVEHCSLDSFGNEACARIGSVYFSLTNVTTTSSSSTSSSSTSSTSSTSTTTTPPVKESNPPVLISSNAPKTVFGRRELASFTVVLEDSSGIEYVSWTTTGFEGSWCNGSASPAGIPKRVTLQVGCEIPRNFGGNYELWITAVDYWGNRINPNDWRGIRTGLKFRVDFPTIFVPTVIDMTLEEAQPTLDALSKQLSFRLNYICTPRAIEVPTIVGQFREGEVPNDLEGMYFYVSNGEACP